MKKLSTCRSMTGYGRASRTFSLGILTVELQSVNRKMLDMDVCLPKNWFSLEIDIRKWVAEHLQRGQLKVRVTLHSKEFEPSSYSAELNTLKNLKEYWEKIALELGFVPKESVDLNFLKEQLNAIPKQDELQEEASTRQVLKELVQEALQHLIEMKEQEGAALAEDIFLRLKNIEKGLGFVLEHATDAALRFRQRLESKFKELSLMNADGEDRIAREIVVYAERIDITEE
ncbi:MAG: YicC/YloC family endoribonuclease, partial [Anaerolineae bacterium]